ncbi:MAG: hypothetical protein LBG16_05925 [Elusimicrobiota bacterium]|nr:hypothetical protein [Elusimicrobiota bacterium]
MDNNNGVYVSSVNKDRIKMGEEGFLLPENSKRVELKVNNLAADNLAIVSFNNLNNSVVSAHITPVFITGKKTITVYITFSDEDSSFRDTSEFTIVDGLKDTHYIPVYPIGKARRVNIIFIGEDAAFSDIALNETIPLDPVFLRVMLVAGLMFAAWALRRYNLFKNKVNPASKAQSAGFIVMAACLVSYAAFTSFTHVISDAKKLQSREKYSEYTYSKLLPDALLAGRTWLDVPVNGALRQSEEAGKTYDIFYRQAIAGDKDYSDIVYYKGKFYAYFGIVPALLLYAPFKAITGLYLPTETGVFIFCAVVMIFLSLLWRNLVYRYMPDMKYAVFILGGVTLSICSLIPILTSDPCFYQAAQSGGMMFVIIGFYLLEKFIAKQEKGIYSYISLSSACLCFAISVGCRPPLVLVSAVVPVAVWQCLKQRGARFKTILAVAAPYIAVALPLMWYNYIRFGNVAEFGISYHLTGENVAAVYSVNNPIQMLYRALAAIKHFLLNPPYIFLKFPFVRFVPAPLDGNTFIFNPHSIGLLCIPVIWYIFGLRSATAMLRGKHNIIRKVIFSLPVIGIFMLVITGSAALDIRYEADFAWLFVLPALFCLGSDNKNLGIKSIIMAVSILLVAFGAVTTMDVLQAENPKLYYYLERAFNILGGM